MIYESIRALLSLFAFVGVMAFLLVVRLLVLDWLDRAGRELEAMDAEEGGNV